MGLRHKTTRGNVYLIVGKMEPSVDNMPGVKESAKTYLAAKQIPQLFQVAQLPRDLTLRDLLRGSCVQYYRPSETTHITMLSSERSIAEQSLALALYLMRKQHRMQRRKSLLKAH